MQCTSSGDEEVIRQIPIYSSAVGRDTFHPCGTVVSGVAIWLTFMSPANTTEEAFVTRLRVNHWMRIDVRVYNQG